MPRLARNVFDDVHHHITQRGNRQEDVFFTDEDRERYLIWLDEYCKKWSVELMSYCLMSNHIHLVLRPSTETGLQNVLKPLHMRYAQRINKRYGWQGHLWQGRFFSSAMDDAYTWAAIRYVERNPVVAGIVQQAEDYRWSSAAARCGLVENKLLVSNYRLKIGVKPTEWSAWLSQVENPEKISLLEKHVEKGLPCGGERFIKKLEKRVGKSLRYKPQGRPFKENKG